MINTPHEHDDDMPVGRILSRREVLALLGGVSASVLLVACGDTTPTNTTTGQLPSATHATPASSTTLAATTSNTASAASSASTSAVTCAVVRPEVTEGPYFKDEKINRSDIRSDTATGVIKQGVPLVLSFQVSQIANAVCTALKGAQIDIWHCDAVGTYSDTADPNWTSTVGQNYLRGYQLTDDKGAAQFTTIYPGWYSGRTIHIHFKVRTTGTNGQPYEFTSQLFFDDNLSPQILTQAPYNTKKGTRDTLNVADSIYQSAGSQMQLVLTPANSGYTTNFTLALDLSDTEVGKSDSASGSGSGMPAGGPGGGPMGGPGGNPPSGGYPGGPGGPGVPPTIN